MNQNRIYGRQYRAEAGEGGEGGAGSIDPAEFTKLQEAFQSTQESMLKLEENNKLLLQEKKDAKTAAQTAIEEAARKSGDVKALEESWKTKLSTETTALNEQLGLYKQTINKITSGAAAKSLAAELALPGSADVLMPHIEKRLHTEMTEDGAVTRVLDKSGKPSALSIEDLKKEIESDKAFAPLLLGSMANGPGYVGKKGVDMSKTMKRSDFNNMPAVDQAKHFKEGGKVID
jgi:hypothetical protein